MGVLPKKWLMKILIITYLSYNRCALQMVVIPKKIVQFMTVYDQLFKILLCYQRQFKNKINNSVKRPFCELIVVQ